MLALARAGATPIVATGTPKRATPNLDAQLRTYRAQLADWVTCPSAKTPQGKEKIEQISAKLESVKNEIKKSDGTSPASPNSLNDQQRKPSGSASKTDGHVDYLSSPGRVGSNVDTYA